MLIIEVAASVTDINFPFAMMKLFTVIEVMNTEGELLETLKKYKSDRDANSEIFKFVTIRLEFWILTQEKFPEPWNVK